MIQGGDNYSDQPAPLGGGGPNSPLTDTGIICGEMTATLVWSDYQSPPYLRISSREVAFRLSGQAHYPTIRAAPRADERQRRRD
jgi:hypothetical protein